jgi:hypothetical protein
MDTATINTLIICSTIILLTIVFNKQVKQIVLKLTSLKNVKKGQEGYSAEFNDEIDMGVEKELLLESESSVENEDDSRRKWISL